MTAYRAGTARVSSTVTKTVGTNPRPRKYATASERQAAYRARAPEVCFRAEAKTVETLDNIADTLDQSRADLLLSMTKFALANHDWARFGLTHKPLPFGYGVQPATNPAPIWKRKRPKSLGKPVPLTPKQKAAAKAMAKAAGRKYPNLVDNIAASRLENPTVKKPTPAQLAARAKFAEMARSGAFKRKRKANPAKKTVSEKISQLVREGYPQKQAVAVALSEERAGKVKATPRKRKSNPMPNQVTETIYQQLGGNRFVVMTGAKNFVAYPDLLEFTIPRNMSKANRVRVYYEPGSDLYTVTFNKTTGLSNVELQRFEDVYADQLRSLFTQVTGMETSLGTLGRKPNPATGAKKSRTKLNPVRDFYYVVKCGQYYDGQFSSEHYTLDEVKKIAQQKADKYGCPAKITEIH